MIITFVGPEARLHDGIHQSVFMAPLVPPPARDLPHCWEQHTKLLPDVHKYRANDVAAWSIQQVVSFVEGLPGCQEQACIFQEEVKIYIFLRPKKFIFINITKALL